MNNQCLEKLKENRLDKIMNSKSIVDLFKSSLLVYEYMDSNNNRDNEFVLKQFDKLGIACSSVFLHQMPHTERIVYFNKDCDLEKYVSKILEIQPTEKYSFNDFEFFYEEFPNYAMAWQKFFELSKEKEYSNLTVDDKASFIREMYNLKNKYYHNEEPDFNHLINEMNKDLFLKIINYMINANSYLSSEKGLFFLICKKNKRLLQENKDIIKNINKEIKKELLVELL